MNKRIYFILFPIFVLLLSSSSIWGNAMSGPGKSFGLTAAQTTIQNNFPFPTDLKKEEPKINKNVIRIKAWDDAFIVNIPTHWEPVVHTVYYARAIYSAYSFVTLDIPLPAYNLRGPPLVI